MGRKEKAGPYGKRKPESESLREDETAFPQGFLSADFLFL